MANKLVFNPTTGQFDTIKYIQQVTSDPASPPAQEAWVLASGGGGGGGGGVITGFIGGFPLLTAGTPAYTYTLKYRTKEGTTVSVALS